MEEGFIFINEEGKYAYEGDAGGFSTGKAIRWTNDLHSADIFSRNEPWITTVGASRHRDCLKWCQALPARATRVVQIGVFTKVEEGS